MFEGLLRRFLKQVLMMGAAHVAEIKSSKQRAITTPIARG